MHLLLNKNGTYQKTNNIVSVEGVKYIAVEISTAIKGPTYTMVKASKFNFTKEIAKIEIDVEYASQDQPCSEETSMEMPFNIENVSDFYSIHPLIKQMYDFNDFSAEIGYIERCITIDSIRFFHQNDRIDIVSDDLSDEIDEYFLSNVFNTHTDDIFGDCVLILTKENTWYFCDIEKIPKSFKYIGISIPELSTFYMLTKKQFDKLSSVNLLQVYIDDRPFYPKIAEMDILITTDECDPKIDFCSCEGHTLSLILRICHHLPQLLLLEKEIFNKTAALIIIVECDNITYSLTVNDTDTFKGICLFKVLIKLLGF